MLPVPMLPAMAAAAGLLLLPLRQGHRGVGGRVRGPVELGTAVAVQASRHQGAQLVCLAEVVALVLGALGNVAGLLRLLWVGIHGVAPRLIHALVGVPAVVVVPDAVAPDLPLLVVVQVRRVRHRFDLTGLGVRFRLGPLLTGAAGSRGGRHSAVALPLFAACLRKRDVLLMVAVLHAHTDPRTDASPD